MLTIDSLKEFGADTAEGLARCYNNEEFYLGLVKTVPKEPGFESLESTLASGDLNSAFEYAHALKGVLVNLSLTALSEPMSELTEHLRAREEMDYTPLISEIMKRREALADICEK